MYGLEELSGALIIGYPVSTKMIVPDAGHISNLENPNDFTKLVTPFIDR